MERFELKKEHLALAGRLFFHMEHGDGCETPCADFKRPYGNSDVYADVAEILGVEKVESDDGDEYYPKGTSDMCAGFHGEMATAVEVMLQAKTFTPGWYQKERYSCQGWTLSQTDHP